MGYRCLLAIAGDKVTCYTGLDWTDRLVRLVEPATVSWSAAR